jgi:hypothetical protein
MQKLTRLEGFAAFTAGKRLRSLPWVWQQCLLAGVIKKTEKEQLYEEIACFGRPLR